MEGPTATERFFQLLDVGMERYLKTQSSRMLEEELHAALSDKPSEFATRPELTSLSARSLPEASATAQALRQGEQAANGSWGSARE